MKITDLIKQLKKIQKAEGDIEVLMQGHNDCQHAITFAQFRTAEEDEYPKSWNMPKGFKFVSLCD
jgi:hypothetical protein